jgi:hypothetical protein
MPVDLVDEVRQRPRAKQPPSLVAKRLLPWRGTLIEPGRHPVQHPPRRQSVRAQEIEHGVEHG